MVKRGSFLIIAFFFILLCIFPFVSAVEFDNQKAVDWLKMQDFSALEIPEFVFSSLALKSNGEDIASYVNVLEGGMDVNGCFPVGECNVKDTALAILLLNDEGKDVEQSVEWINSKKGFLYDVSDGGLYLQIITDGTGTCGVYEEDIEKATLSIEDGVVKFRNRIVNWIKLNDMSIQIDEPIKNIIVDCRDVDDDVLISLIRIDGDTFHIEQEIENQEVELEINNACYGSTSTSCSKQATFYASWVFTEIGEELDVLPYLERNVVSIWDYAIMNLINPTTEYSDWLKDNQIVNHWENVYTSSFAIYSLKDKGYDEEISNAVEWIEGKQNEDGLIGDKGLDTAVALYLGFGDKVSPTIPVTNGINNGGGDVNPSVCGNYIVEYGEECDGEIDTIEEGAVKDCEYSCLNNCQCPREVEGCESDFECPDGQRCDLSLAECYIINDCVQDYHCKLGEICGDDGTCSKKVEGCYDKYDCDVGEECVDGVCIFKGVETELYCDNGEDDDGDGLIDCDDGDCEDDEACKKKSLWWVWLIIFILVLVLGGIFLYGKFSGQKKPQKPKYPMGFGQMPEKRPQKEIVKQSPRPIFRRPQPSAKDMALEKKLDKSLKEAEKVLDKK